MSWIHRLIDRHLLPEGDLDLRDRYHQALCLTAVVLVGLVLLPINYIQGMQASVGVATLLFGVVALGLYLASRRGHFFPTGLWLALLAAANVSWFPNGGSTGSVVFFFFPAAMFSTVSFAGATRTVLTSLVFANMGALLWADHRWPDLARPFATSGDRLIDIAAGFAGSGLAIVMMSLVLLRVYQRDRARLSETATALAQSRAQLSDMFQRNPDAVALVDATTQQIIEVNARMERLTGWPRDLVIGKTTTADFRLWVDPAVRQAFWDRVAAELALDDFPARFQRRDGTEFWGSVSARFVDIGGRRCVLTTTRDVTALKQAEADRDRIRLQFLEAQKMESLGSLAGGVAHDFNNMLGGIMGYTDLLMAGEPDPARQEQLKAILQAATRSSELTRKLLAFARRGRNIVESVDLNAAVHESMAMLTPSLGSDVTTTLRLEAAHHVDADPTQLNQLIVNLCLNASEAMPAGGTLAVGTRDVLLDAATCVPWELAPGSYVELTVTDSGVGMTDEVRQRIFEPFFTTKTGGTINGSGLGLPTVYGVVHLHRGAIKVDSAAGEGATFTVLLPKGTLAAPDVASDSAVPGGGGLVLVVEDEAMLRQLATTALTHLGYRSLTACDGVEGVDLFRAHHHELAGVLLDLKMPRKSGRETFTEMRAIDANVPVLLCSGYGDNEEAQGLISLGAIGLLPKPYRIGELAEQISRFKR